MRRLAWTAIVLFVMALVFAFNRGPILAWLAANHTPLLVGILQSPLWLVAFLLIVLGLQCWLDIVEVDRTPFAIILHALGIMLCIGWWVAGVALSLRQRADVSVYALTGGFILTCLFAWIMDRRQNGRQGDFPEAARPDCRLLRSSISPANPGGRTRKLILFNKNPVNAKKPPLL